MYVPQSSYILFWGELQHAQVNQRHDATSVLMRPYPMILVLGSIPRMIFWGFARRGLILCANRLLEQKYQINHQLLVGPALCIIVVGASTGRSRATRLGKDGARLN